MFDIKTEHCFYSDGKMASDFNTRARLLYCKFSYKGTGPWAKALSAAYIG